MQGIISIGIGDVFLIIDNLIDIAGSGIAITLVLQGISRVSLRHLGHDAAKFGGIRIVGNLGRS